MESVAECQSLRKENVTLTTRIDSLQKKVRMLEKAMESPESKRTLCRIFERYAQSLCVQDHFYCGLSSTLHTSTLRTFVVTDKLLPVDP